MEKETLVKIIIKLLDQYRPGRVNLQPSCQAQSETNNDVIIHGLLNSHLNTTQVKYRFTCVTFVQEATINKVCWWI